MDHSKWFWPVVIGLGILIVLYVISRPAKTSTATPTATGLPGSDWLSMLSDLQNRINQQSTALASIDANQQAMAQAEGTVFAGLLSSLQQGFTALNNNDIALYNLLKAPVGLAPPIGANIPVPAGTTSSGNVTPAKQTCYLDASHTFVCYNVPN